MMTERVKELKAAYLDLRRLNVGGKVTQEETNKANEVWLELFEKCKPTKEEYNEIATDLVVTTDIFYYLMKMAGFWSNSN